MISKLIRGFSRSGLLVAAALLLASATATAQTQPPDQPAAAPEPAPAPPPTVGEGAEITYPRMMNGAIMLGKESWLRVGLQAQVWADYLQALSADGNYTFNMLLRRARLLVATQITKDANIFLQFDAPRLGTATVVSSLPVVTCTTTQNADTGAITTSCAAANPGKRFNAQDGGGEILQDAFGELKISGDAFMLEAGLMVIPFSHNELQSTTTFITLDVGNVSAGVLPFTSGTRDTGFQLKGYLLEDHLEYRLGVFSGGRQAANGTNPIGHNMPRITGHVQYQILEPDAKGYTYVGHTYGKKKMLGVSAGFDVQKGDDLQLAGGAKTAVDAYWAASAGVFGAFPLGEPDKKKGADEIAFVGEFFHYDGGTNGAAPTAAIVPQNDFLVEAGYYNNDIRLSLFGKFEYKKTQDDKNQAQDQMWIMGGLKYYVLPGNNMNFTLAYQNIRFPNAASGAPDSQNEVTLQAQFFYY